MVQSIAAPLVGEESLGRKVENRSVFPDALVSV